MPCSCAVVTPVSEPMRNCTLLPIKAGTARAPPLTNRLHIKAVLAPDASICRDPRGSRAGRDRWVSGAEFFGGLQSIADGYQRECDDKEGCQLHLKPLSGKKLVDVTLYHAGLAEFGVGAALAYVGDFVAALAAGFDLLKMAVKIFQIVVHLLKVASPRLLAVDGRSMAWYQFLVVAIEKRLQGVSQLGILPKKVTG